MKNFIHTPPHIPVNAYKKLGFKPTHSIETAMEDLIEAFETGKLRNTLSDIRYFNIKTMKAVNLQ